MRKIILSACLIAGGIALSVTAYANNWLLYLPAILTGSNGGGPTDPPDPPGPATGILNDTGITASVAAKDDATYGRDTNPENTNDDGYAGFEFTDVTGGCIKDEVTGLVWSPDQGASNVDGIQTKVDAANSALLCGLTGWRMPTVKELAGIVDYHKTSGAMIESAFFNDIVADWYWTSTDGFGSLSGKRWGVSFDNGTTDALSTGSLDTKRVLLVFENTTDV